MHRLFCLGLAVFLAGCASSGSVSPYPRVESSEVVIYEAEADIDAEYDVLGQVQPRRQSSYGVMTEDQILADARVKAARLGANALLVVDQDETLTDAKIMQATRNGGAVYRTLYVALRVLPAPSAQ